MNQDSQDFQHPDFIWTWKESQRGQRQSIWLPYLRSIEKKAKSSHWILAWNGGQLEADLKSIDFIMLFGGVGSLPVEFLDSLNEHRICLAIHRRNMPRPYLFIPASGADDDDILTAQIKARSNEKAAAYVARTLIREKFASSEDQCPVSGTDFKKLAAARNADQVRTIEAAHAGRYWPAYFMRILGDGAPLPTRRDFPHPANSALDACSFFLHGVLLRWILFHKLSPFHGFLHRPTDYPSLVFDLIEPYRWWIDESVARAFAGTTSSDARVITAAAIDQLKLMLDEAVYVPATRQTVRRKSLLHGAVLALRAWLLERQARFVLPVEGARKGGRPPQVGFTIPGYRKE